MVERIIEGVGGTRRAVTIRDRGARCGQLCAGATGGERTHTARKSTGAGLVHPRGAGHAGSRGGARLCGARIGQLSTSSTGCDARRTRRSVCTILKGASSAFHAQCWSGSTGTFTGILQLQTVTTRPYTGLARIHITSCFEGA